jgi:hypothetical protein
VGLRIGDGHLEFWINPPSGLNLESVRLLRPEISIQIEPEESSALSIADTVLPVSAMGSSSVWDGTLSPDEFSASAKALVTKWGEIGVDDSLPDWAWRPCCKMGVPSEVDLTSSLCAILVIMVFFLV